MGIGVNRGLGAVHAANSCRRSLHWVGMFAGSAVKTSKELLNAGLNFLLFLRYGWILDLQLQGAVLNSKLVASDSWGPGQRYK